MGSIDLSNEDTLNGLFHGFGGNFLDLFPGVEIGFRSLDTLQTSYVEFVAWGEDEDHGYCRWADAACGGAMERLAHPDRTWWINLDGGDRHNGRNGCNQQVPGYQPLWMQPWIDPTKHIIECRKSGAEAQLSRRFMAVPGNRIREVVSHYWGHAEPGMGIEAYCVSVPEKAELLAVSEQPVECQAKSLFAVCSAVLSTYSSEMSRFIVMSTLSTSQTVQSVMDIQKLYGEAGLTAEKVEECGSDS
jgi:hypothetical protein